MHIQNVDICFAYFFVLTFSPSDFFVFRWSEKLKHTQNNPEREVLLHNVKFYYEKKRDFPGPT